jgi:hypothetical protein
MVELIMHLLIFAIEFHPVLGIMLQQCALQQALADLECM